MVLSDWRIARLTGDALAQLASEGGPQAPAGEAGFADRR